MDRFWLVDGRFGCRRTLILLFSYFTETPWIVLKTISKRRQIQVLWKHCFQLPLFINTQLIGRSISSLNHVNYVYCLHPQQNMNYNETSFLPCIIAAKSKQSQSCRFCCENRNFFPVDWETIVFTTFCKIFEISRVLCIIGTSIAINYIVPR